MLFGSKSITAMILSSELVFNRVRFVILNLPMVVLSWLGGTTWQPTKSIVM